MADRYDREYSRDRSLWRDREEGNRNWEEASEARGGRDRGSQMDYDRPARYRGEGSQGEGRRRGQREAGQEEDTEREYYSGPVTYTYTEFWLIPGPFTGIGPSDFTRDPERLREDIIERLTMHGQIDASDIEVEVNEDCEVTLTGEVDSRRVKRMAEDAADSVWGINDIHNQLKVRGRQSRGREEQEKQDKQGRQSQGSGNGQTSKQGRSSSSRGQSGSRSKS